MIIEYTIIDKNTKIKDFLLKQGISHRLLIKLKKNDCIYRKNDKIILDLNYPESSDNIVPTKIPLDIIHEDDSILIINKPAGIPVHPSLHYYANSLSNGVKYYFESIRFTKES